MKEKSSWQKTRKLFNDVHLWLGIGSGIILFLVCLSGTIYTFHHEVEELLEPERFFVEVPAGANPLPAAELIARTEEETGGKVQSLSIAEDKGRAYALNVKKEGERGRGENYMLNPYSGEIIASGRGATSGFFMSMFRLHRWLLLDSKIGRPIVGIATIIFVFIVLTGLVIWFPQKLKSWKQGLKIKTSGNWKRLNHDLHNSLGFYASFLLLIMALSGLCWSFGWYRDGLSQVLGAEVFGGRREKPLTSEVPAGNPSATALSVEGFLSKADELLPYEGDYRISLPDTADAAVVISKGKTGFFAVSATDKVHLDQYSGEVLKMERFSDKPLNEQIASSIKPIHTGEIFGTFSKIIYFLVCLIATSLPVTGTIIWINKLKKKAKKTGKGRRKNEKPLASA